MLMTFIATDAFTNTQLNLGTWERSTIPRRGDLIWIPGESDRRKVLNISHYLADGTVDIFTDDPSFMALNSQIREQLEKDELCQVPVETPVPAKSPAHWFVNKLLSLLVPEIVPPKPAKLVSSSSVKIRTTSSHPSRVVSSLRMTSRNKSLSL